MTFLPIVERELRVAARKPATWWLRFFAALVVMVVVLFSVGGSRASVAPAAVAQDAFSVVSGLMLAVCLLAGVFLTSDCLSSEKREGTAGLLFLTDLRGYDVVLGKLAAGSIHAGYALLAAFPMLALPMLLGGVTGGEFWRVMLCLAATLFFSLAIGMAVSALSREVRQTMLGTLAGILALSGMLPALQALATYWRFGLIPAFLWPSPGYLFYASYDSNYSLYFGPREYWGSLGVIGAVSLACLASASFLLPRSWQEKAHTTGALRPRGFWQRARFGGASARRQLRARLLPENPFYWLCVRDRMPGIMAGLILLVAFCFWLPFFLVTIRGSGKGPGAEVAVLIYTTLACGLILKCLFAVEASRRFHDDRQSGALELLLVTTLPVSQIISGQRLALRKQFTWPASLVLLLLAALLALSLDPRRNGLNDNVSRIIFSGCMVVLIADLYALSAVAMWRGMRARQHHRAVLGSLARILFLPWLLLFLVMILRVGRSRYSDEFIFAGWFLLGLVIDCVWAQMARKDLHRRFREYCVGTTRVSPAAAWRDYLIPPPGS